MLSGPALAAAQTASSEVADPLAAQRESCPEDRSPVLPTAPEPSQPVLTLPAQPLIKELPPSALTPPCPSRPTETAVPQLESEIANVSEIQLPAPQADFTQLSSPPRSPSKRANLDLSARSQTATALAATRQVGWEKVSPIALLALSEAASQLPLEISTFGFTNVDWNLAPVTDPPEMNAFKFPHLDWSIIAEPKAIDSSNSVWQRIAESNSFGFTDRQFNLAEVPPVLRPVEGDPELGILRVQSIPNRNPASGTGDTPQLPCPNPDPELGCVRIKPIPPPPPIAARGPSVFLLARMDYFRSSNIYSALDPITDGLGRPGIGLYLVPALGPNTFFVGSIDFNWVRYSEQSIINYNELRFRAGIMQRLSPVMFGEIGWGNQQLFIQSNDIFGLPKGTRFLNDHALRIELSRRDQLANKLSLNTFYQFRLSFADPVDRSRLSNSLFLSLNYDIQPNLQIGLDYQFVLVNFTQQQREDQFHQIIARLSYTLFRNTQLSLFAGYSFGNSTDPLVDFNGSVFGVSLSTSLGLF